MKQNNFTQQTHFIGILLSGCDDRIKGVVNMFHGLCIPYIGKTNLSVKKPAARSLRSSLEQLTKSQLKIRLFTTLC